MRVLHVSDLHFPVRFRHVPLAGWLSKRAIGMGNYVLGRGKYYREAHRKVKALARLRDQAGVDLVICTGDYTGLGSEEELKEAREAIAPLADAPLGFVTVPGNHDLYITDTWRRRRFDHHFAAFLESDLPEARVDGTPWPLVRFVGDDVAVVAVNSASPRPFWTSNGRIPPQEIEALAALLRQDAFDGRFVFVMTHYAARIEDDQPDDEDRRRESPALLRGKHHEGRQRGALGVRRRTRRRPRDARHMGRAGLRAAPGRVHRRLLESRLALRSGPRAEKGRSGPCAETRPWPPWHAARRRACRPHGRCGSHRTGC